MLRIRKSFRLDGLINGLVLNSLNFIQFYNCKYNLLIEIINFFSFLFSRFVRPGLHRKWTLLNIMLEKSTSKLLMDSHDQSRFRILIKELIFN